MLSRESRYRAVAKCIAVVCFSAALYAGQSNTLSAQTSREITVDVKDSSLKYVVYEIARQAGLKVVVGANDGIMQKLSGKKVTVKLSTADVLEAYFTALSGTDLVAQRSPSGQTIAIGQRGSRADTAAKPSRGGIVGKIVDSVSKAGIAGVTVSIASQGKTAVTDSDGNFKFADVAPGDVKLLVRVLGYGSKQTVVTVVSGQTHSISVLLTSSATSLNEVVTTATGQQRRVEIAHDIAKIDPAKIMERSPVRSVIDILDAAQVPGLLVQRGGGDPGSPARVRIRGIGSISESNDPVYILDGVWIDASVSRPSRVDDLDPASIETIEVIRGPSAATLFGQDASNGVIVITTKKGKVGPTRWNLSYSRDWGQTYGRRPLLYAGMGKAPSSTQVTSCSIAQVLAYLCTQDSVAIVDPNHPLFSREGTETKDAYTLQMDGGAQNVTYSITLSTNNTVGVRRVHGYDKIRYRILGYEPASEYDRPSALTRNSITSALVFTPRSNLTVSMTLAGAQTNLKDNVLTSNWNGLTPLGWIPWDLNPDTAFGPYGQADVVASQRPEKSTSTLISSSVQYRPRGNTVINGNFGAEKTNQNQSMFDRKTACQIGAGCGDVPGYRQESARDNSVYTVRLNASTGLNLGSFNRYLDIRPSIGGDFRKTDASVLTLAKTDIPVGDRSMNSGLLAYSFTNVAQNATAGWYINSSVGLFRRVYFDVGIRQDIGSAITSSKDAIYPKIGGSWLVSDESFWRSNSFINTLRIRSALGHSAVQPSIGDINGRFITSTQYIDGKFVNSTQLDGNGNNRLQPERAVEMEFGFDLDMLNDRINVIATYAHKENKNTLVEKTVPPSFGIPIGGIRKENVAKVRNRNMELSTNARVFESASALLVLNYTLTLSDNRVMRLGDGVTPFGTELDRVAAGYPLAGVWSRQVIGYRDANKDGLLAPSEVILSDSIVYMGWSQPRYRAGYGVSFTLNNQVTFDSRFAYQSRYVTPYTQIMRYGAEDVNAPLPDQARSVVSELSGIRPVSDMRWSSASVVYHVPQRLLKRFGGRSVSIALQGSNLGLWTNFVGRDPGIHAELMDKEASGDDGMTPPAPRKYVLDFKIGF